MPSESLSDNIVATDTNQSPLKSIKTVILYSSVEGQTLKIIERIKTSIEGDVSVFNIDTKPNIDFSKYEKVLVGASIRYGKIRPNMLAYLNENKQQLSTIPNAFFLVCLTARKPEKAEPATNTYMKKFDLICEWQPQCKAVFAGALLYSRYNWWQTLLIQLIMKMTGGSTDKTKDIELTDWQKVDEFSQTFTAL